MASQSDFHIPGPDAARESRSRPQPPAGGPVHDLLCVGFGPASLAIAIALHDALRDGSIARTPNVLFLEKQAQFAWHAGMLLPGAKMQISFVKDLATLRDPRSHFTFLNYLHKNDRLVEFTNLSTFLPARIEYEDYLRWCAGFFSDVVRYNNEVVSVVPDVETSDSVRTFTVVSRNAKTGAITKHRARNVVLAVGGQPSIPKVLPANSPKVVHSSQYAHMVPKILKNKDAPYRVAVVGAGQSAAEIFNNIQVMYPNSKTSLVMKSEFLKPSDDSPFVNSIFNPEFVDVLYPRPPQYRQSLISDAKATNYGVVRLELIEKLYELMYDQRREIGSDETKWPHRILGGRRVVGVEETSNGLRLRVRHAPADAVALEADGLVDVETQESAKAVESARGDDELLEVDLIIAATGYRRNAHVEMLKDAWHLLPQNKEDNPERSDQWAVRDVTKTCRVMEVSREYRVQFREGVVAPGSGVWLQGCCEGTHGLSDTLLSVLATRSGEMVKSIFGTKEESVLRAHL